MFNKLLQILLNFLSKFQQIIKQFVLNIHKEFPRNNFKINNFLKRFWPKVLTLVKTASFTKL